METPKTHDKEPAAAPKEIVTKAEAAAILGVSIRFLEGLIAEDKLPVTRLGRAVRINRADVLALVPSRRTDG